MTRRKRSSGWRCAVLGLLVGAGCRAVGVGDRAPALDGLVRVEPDGERPIDAATELAGRPMLVRFWATWCGPCRATMPYLQERCDQLALGGLTVLAITDEDPATVRRYLAEHAYTFPVAIDPSGAIARAWDVSYLPCEFLVDGSGEIVGAGFATDEGRAAELAAVAEAADDVARLRSLLSRRAYLAVADALPVAGAEAAALAVGDPGLPAFAAVWAPREADLARRAQMAQDFAIGRRVADIGEDRWRQLGAHGIVMRPDASPETDPLFGVMLDGHAVHGDDDAFAHRHMRRAVVLEDLARGAAPRADVDREATRRLQEARSEGR